MYLTLKEPGSTNQAGDVSPAGSFVGLGTKISNTQLDMETGSLENTGNQLDVAISGQGFFKVKILSSIGDGTAYTRNGQFFVNNQQELVVGQGDGYKLDPPITQPQARAFVARERTLQVVRHELDELLTRQSPASFPTPHAHTPRPQRAPSTGRGATTLSDWSR